jgi:hypothetical protein
MKAPHTGRVTMMGVGNAQKMGTDAVPGVDLDRFREELLARPLRPYEVLFDTDRWTEETEDRALGIAAEGWSIGGGRTVTLRPPIAWDELLADDRSRHFHLHSWYPLGPVLSAFDAGRNDSHLQFALQVALDWLRQHPVIDVSIPFAWYDMAIGLRAVRLGYLTDAVAREPVGTDAVLTALLRGLLLHRDALADDALFPAHSNHGFYFAAGQAALAARFPELPGMEAAGVQARERLDRLIRNHFTVEGVHREHSPKYHWLVMDTIEGLRSAGLLDEEEHGSGLNRMQEALAWFVLPNGRLAMFGDTDHREMTGLQWPHLRNESLRFVLSGGREGTPPADSIRAFPASGYVVCRSHWPAGTEDFSRGSYLAQACAFHSRTHKHADDLTMVWYDRGQEILVDAGGYGYSGKTEPGSELWKDGFWYADPRRIYVESTRAHNTVQVDARNLPRRNVEPYGSSLMRWGEKGGVYFTESAVRHWDTVCHRRILLHLPGEWLLVFDWLLDEESQPREFVQRFHFAPELDLLEHGSGRLRFQVPGEGGLLHVVSLDGAPLLPPVHGQEEPELLGWISRKDRELIPCWTSGYGVKHRPGHTFATLFAFGPEPPRPSPGTRLTDPEVDRFRAAWAQGERSHVVTFHRSTTNPFSLDYRIGRASGANAHSGA